MPSKTGTDLIILRHGQAMHNLGDETAHTFAGSKIDSELAPQGVENAQQLAKTLNLIGPVDIIMTSPQKRSQQTSEIINHLIGNVPIITLDELKEINIGDFQGHTEAEVRQLFPKEAQAFYDGDIENWHFPHGENSAEIFHRAKIALEKIRSLTLGKKRVVISGHGMFNRVLFYKLKPKNKELWSGRSYPHDRIEIMELV